MKPPRTFWTPEEDARLIAFVEEHGRSCETFRKAIAVLPHRNPKCMESRYLRYLDPQRKTAGEWTEEEDAHLLSCFAADLGIQKVAQSMPHRTRGQISCRYMTLRRRQKRAAATAGSVAAAQNRARRAEEAEQTKTEEEALPPVQLLLRPNWSQKPSTFSMWEPRRHSHHDDRHRSALAGHRGTLCLSDRRPVDVAAHPQALELSGLVYAHHPRTAHAPPKVASKTTLLHHFGVVRQSSGHPFAS